MFQYISFLKLPQGQKKFVLIFNYHWKQDIKYLLHWALGNGQLPKYPLILTNCCEQWICAFLVRNNVFTAKLILSSGGISVVYCRSCEAILIVEGREAKNLNLLKKKLGSRGFYTVSSVDGATLRNQGAFLVWLHWLQQWLK